MLLSALVGQDQAGLQEKIACNLDALFNTVSMPYWTEDDQTKTVLHFGMPDYSGVKGKDIALINQEITRRIAQFEPRLTQLSVSVTSMDYRQLNVTVHAVIREIHQDFQYRRSI